MSPLILSKNFARLFLIITLLTTASPYLRLGFYNLEDFSLKRFSCESSLLNLKRIISLYDLIFLKGISNYETIRVIESIVQPLVLVYSVTTVNSPKARTTALIYNPKVVFLNYLRLYQLSYFPCRPLVAHFHYKNWMFTVGVVYSKNKNGTSAIEISKMTEILANIGGPEIMLIGTMSDLTKELLNPRLHVMEVYSNVNTMLGGSQPDTLVTTSTMLARVLTFSVNRLWELNLDWLDAKSLSAYYPIDVLIDGTESNTLRTEHPAAAKYNVEHIVGAVLIPIKEFPCHRNAPISSYRIRYMYGYIKRFEPSYKHNILDHYNAFLPSSQFLYDILMLKAVEVTNDYAWRINEALASGSIIELRLGTAPYVRRSKSCSLDGTSFSKGPQPLEVDSDYYVDDDGAKLDDSDSDYEDTTKFEETASALSQLGLADNRSVPRFSLGVADYPKLYGDMMDADARTYGIHIQRIPRMRRLFSL